MLKRIPKVLLLVAFLTALAVSSRPTFGKFKCERKFCEGIVTGFNCREKNGTCHTEKCKKGEPCSDSACLCFIF